MVKGGGESCRGVTAFRASGTCQWPTVCLRRVDLSCLPCVVRGPRIVWLEAPSLSHSLSLTFSFTHLLSHMADMPIRSTLHWQLADVIHIPSSATRRFLGVRGIGRNQVNSSVKQVTSADCGEAIALQLQRRVPHCQAILTYNEQHEITIAF